MITREEKKIIKNIENIIEMTFFPSNFGKGKIFINIDLDHIKVLLNLIEKQDKMIDKAIEYIKEKQKIQYKYALSQIECDELLKILERR